MICVFLAMRALNGVGSARASSKEFVCKDCVPPNTEAMASTAVRMMLLYGSWKNTNEYQLTRSDNCIQGKLTIKRGDDFAQQRKILGLQLLPLPINNLSLLRFPLALSLSLSLSPLLFLPSCLIVSFFLPVSFCLCLSIYLCLSVSLFVSLSLPLFLCQSLSLFASLSVCLSLPFSFFLCYNEPVL